MQNDPRSEQEQTRKVCCSCPAATVWDGTQASRLLCLMWFFDDAWSDNCRSVQANLDHKSMAEYWHLIIPEECWFLHRLLNVQSGMVSFECQS